MKVILDVLKRSGAAKKAAGVLAMCFLGMAVAYGGLFHVGDNSSSEKNTATPAVAEAVAKPAEMVPRRPVETAVATASSADATVSAEPVPGPERFNLACIFPEDADKTDPMKSFGGKAFKDLYERDNSWNETVFGASSRKPVTVAGSLGIPRSSLMGKFNITDKNHDPADPSTWVIGKWTKISLDIRDGNGKATPQASNVKEILAMASVYTYYHDMEDAEAFTSYAHRLWNASHSYSMSVSEVYYDKDCITREAVDKAVAKGRVWPSASASTNANEPDADTASPSDALESAPVSESSEQETAAPEGTVEESTADSSAAAGPGAAGPGAAGPGAESSAVESSAGDIFIEEGSVTGESAAADIVIEEGSVTGESAAAEESAADETKDPAMECPGHMDLTIKAVVWNMEGKKNLFTLDKIGNNKASFNEQWQGWTEERISEAKALVEADWYQDYGLSVSLISGTAPLTEAEIEEQMALLPEDLSEERRALAKTALGSIGRIPYYYGGKAVSADYDKNNFYTVIHPDYKGRVFRGLDCSGWLAWVYWNTTGTKLAESSTAGQIHLGRGIRRSDLRTGDIIIRAGNDETMGHVLMFLRWDENGQALCIHETGGITNNVCFKLNEDVGASCRNLVD